MIYARNLWSSEFQYHQQLIANNINLEYHIGLIFLEFQLVLSRVQTMFQGIQSECWLINLFLALRFSSSDSIQISAAFGTKPFLMRLIAVVFETESVLHTCRLPAQVHRWFRWKKNKLINCSKHVFGHLIRHVSDAFLNRLRQNVLDRLSSLTVNSFCA